MPSTTNPTLQKTVLNSVDVSSHMINWAVTREYSGAVAEATIEVSNRVNDIITINEATNGDAVTIQRGIATSAERYIFRGFVVNVEPRGNSYVLKCFGKYWEAMRKNIVASFDKNIDAEAGVISDIYTTLINDNTDLTADATTVQSSGSVFTLDKFVCNNAVVYERCDDLAKALFWQHYYNPEDDKTYFEPRGYVDNGVTLTVGTDIINQPVWNFDSEKMINKIKILGAIQLVQTTESGQIGVVSGYTTSSITLTQIPEDIKVFCDAANPPTTLRTGGKGSVSVTYDYEVDKEEKKINWNTSQYTPGGSDYCETRFSYPLPTPVIVFNQSSIDIYGEYQKVLFKDDILNVVDSEQYARKILEKYKEPFVQTKLRVVGKDILYPGEKIRINDTTNGLTNKEVIITKTILRYPYAYDEIEVGDEVWKEAVWESEIDDRIRRLEEKASKVSEFLLHLIDLGADITFRRMYFAVEKKNIKGDTLIWDNINYGMWDTHKWDYGALPDFDKRIIIWYNNTITENFADEYFKGDTSAYWDTTNSRLAASNSGDHFVFYNTHTESDLAYANNVTLQSAIVSSDETIWGGDQIKYYLSADSGAHYEEATSGATLTFANRGIKDLVSWWTFDNSNSYDSEGSNHGADTNISYVAGIVGTAAQFNGTTSLITIPNHDTLKDIFSGGGTISAWINPNNDGEGDYGRIIDKTEFMFMIGGESGGSANLRFQREHSGNSPVWYSTSKDITMNAWNHVVIVYNEDSINNDATLYVNGISVSVTESAVPSGTPNSDGTNDLIIGNNSVADRTFDGEIEGVRIYNRALLASEVSDIYNLGSGTSYSLKPGLKYKVFFLGYGGKETYIENLNIALTLA